MKDQCHHPNTDCSRPARLVLLRMTSIIKFIPLNGAREEGAPCYILQIDEFRILLDCGWDDEFDPQSLDALAKYVNIDCYVAPDLPLCVRNIKHIDAVIISHADLAHIGALPYAVSKLGLNCPILHNAASLQNGSNVVL